MPHRIAFVTCPDYPELTIDDRPAAAALRRAGAELIIASWHDSAETWEDFDLVVIRSPWDYPEHIPEFRQWLDHLDTVGARVLNPVGLVRRNMDKEYLSGLEASGAAILETHWIPQGGEADLKAILRAHGWSRAVIKPTVSATARRTVVVSAEPEETAQALAREILRDCGLMVQGFAEEIQAEGEWSLVFFNKAYSHSVLKRPKAGDFRVQSDFGGSVAAVEPPAGLVLAAQAILDGLDGPILYARVDGVRRGNDLLLMELELFEPQLFFLRASGSEERFAQAVLEHLS